MADVDGTGTSIYPYLNLLIYYFACTMDADTRFEQNTSSSVGLNRHVYFSFKHHCGVNHFDLKVFLKLLFARVNHPFSHLTH